MKQRLYKVSVPEGGLRLVSAVDQDQAARYCCELDGYIIKPAKAVEAASLVSTGVKVHYAKGEQV